MQVLDGVGDLQLSAHNLQAKIINIPLATFSGGRLERPDCREEKTEDLFWLEQVAKV